MTEGESYDRRTKHGQVRGPQLHNPNGPLTPENHKVIVSIGKKTMIPFGDYSFGFDDFQNTPFEKELSTKLSIR
jgi:hypothetical protein